MLGSGQIMYDRAGQFARDPLCCGQIAEKRVAGQGKVDRSARIRDVNMLALDLKGKDGVDQYWTPHRHPSVLIEASGRTTAATVAILSYCPIGPGRTGFTVAKYLINLGKVSHDAPPLVVRADAPEDTQPLGSEGLPLSAEAA